MAVRRAFYLTHPQVTMDPTVAVPDWGLNDYGRRRAEAFAARLGDMSRTQVVTSAERKALETGWILAAGSGRAIKVCPDMHENDRSATGFLPKEEFERTADAFFANPLVSVRGWETAASAQDRICSAVRRVASDLPDRDLLFVGHGAVGTLLYCDLAGEPISRVFDQFGGGGNFLAFDPDQWIVERGWAPMESLTLR